MVRMRALWFKRPVLILGAIVIIFYLGLIVKSGHESAVGTVTDPEAGRIFTRFSDLEERINKLCESRP